MADRLCSKLQPDGSPCPNAGIWMPVLLMYASVLHGPHPPIPVEIDLALCDQHRESAMIRELVTDSLYEKVEQACSNARKAWPERTLTRLKFLRYDETTLGKMKNRERAEAN